MPTTAGIRRRDGPRRSMGSRTVHRATVVAAPKGFAVTLAADAIEVGWLRGALVRVAELLEDGAPDEAYAFAVAASEPPIVLRYACPNCGNKYEWPGQLDDHLRFAGCWQQRGAWASRQRRAA